MKRLALCLPFLLLMVACKGDQGPAGPTGPEGPQGPPGPGAVVAFANLGGFFDIPTSVTNLGSVSFDALTSGEVLLLITGYAVFFGDNTVVDVGLSTSPSSIDLNFTRAGRQDGTGTLRYTEAFSVEVITPVNAGTNTFYATAQKESVFSANNVNLGDVYMVAIFFPGS